PLSTRVENLLSPVIHVHFQPCSRQRMHRNTEPSSPQSGSARTGLSPVRSHALPSLLARSPGGGASYGGDPVLTWLRCERATGYAATWGHRGRALDWQPAHHA